MTRAPKLYKVARVAKKPLAAIKTILDKYSEPLQKEGSLLYVPESCTESINTVCSICPKMRVISTTHDGCDCTTSKCNNNHWVGTRNWNWLWKEPETFVFVIPKIKRRR